MTKPKSDIFLVYDGDCPVCRHYCKYIKIKETVGTLYLIDARKPSKIMNEITALGLDIDEGMVVKFQGKIYYASNAIHILSLLSTRVGWFNRMNYKIFKSKFLSHLLYLPFKEMRKAILWLCGIPKIDNLEATMRNK